MSRSTYHQLSDAELLEHLKNEAWFKAAAAERIGMELSQLNEDMDQYDDQRRSICDGVKRLLSIYSSLLDFKQSRQQDRQRAALCAELRTFRKRLLLSYRQFVKGPHRRFSYLTDQLGSQQVDLGDYGISVMNRFESGIKVVTQELLTVIDKTIRNCSELKLKETKNAKKKRHTDTQRSNRNRR